MSAFEDYESVAASFDATRVATGIRRIVEAFGASNIPLVEQHVLDCGCGTGNYLAELEQRCGAVVGVDRSYNMLRVARDKLPHSVPLCCADICAMPFANDSFDGVLVNFVLHHLVKPGAGDDVERRLAAAAAAIGPYFDEAFRVLRPDGALVVGTCTPEQQRDGFWWAALIPEAVDRVCERFVPLAPLVCEAQRAGFEIEQVTVVRDEVLQGEAYFDVTGPLRDAWRKGDSTWSLTRDHELAAGLGRLERMIEGGDIESFFAARESERERVGQITLVRARKPIA